MATSQPSKPFTATKLIWYTAGLATVFMSILAMLAWWALDADDDIQYRIVQFYSFSKKLFYTNLISYLILLIIAAYLHRSQNHRGYYLLACGIFLLFAYVGYGLLNNKLILAYQTFDMQEGMLAFNTYFGILLSVSAVLMAGVVFIGVSMKRKKQ